MRLPDGETDGAQHNGFRFDDALVKIGDAVGGHERILGVGGHLMQQILILLDALLDGPTVLMAQNHQQPHAQRGDGVFQ